jgi:hypothetical protein
VNKTPYWNAYRIRQAHQRQSEGLIWPWLRLLPATAGLVLLSVLAQPVWLGFLNGPFGEWSAGIQGAFVRLGLLIVGVQSVVVYGEVIRGSERAILTLMPVDPAEVGLYQSARIGREGLWMVAVAAVLLGPLLLWGQAVLWSLCVVGVIGLWVASLTVSVVIHLSAVGVAASPRWAPLLDMIRGSNPREQAAFIYAPGVVLMGLGGLVAVVSWGVVAVWQGDFLGVFGLSLPFAIGGLFLWRVPAAARAGWYRATAVLADIDARYGVLVEAAEERTVYMDWSLRFLPAGIRIWALKDMRYGWRSRRPWLALTWLVGLLGALSGWTHHPGGPLRVLVMMALGCALCATIATLMAKDEPQELKTWLGDGGVLGLLGRWMVLAVWLQGAVWPGVGVVLIRAGGVEGLWVLCVSQLLALGFSGVAVLCSRLENGGLVTYVGLAIMGLSGLAAACFGG